MRQNKYSFCFYDWVGKSENKGIVISAGNVEEAQILAQAERIKNGKQYKNIKSKHLWDYENGVWVKF